MFITFALVFLIFVLVWKVVPEGFLRNDVLIVRFKYSY